MGSWPGAYVEVANGRRVHPQKFEMEGVGGKEFPVLQWEEIEAFENFLPSPNNPRE